MASLFESLEDNRMVPNKNESGNVARSGTVCIIGTCLVPLQVCLCARLCYIKIDADGILMRTRNFSLLQFCYVCLDLRDRIVKESDKPYLIIYILFECRHSLIGRNRNFLHLVATLNILLYTVILVGLE